MNVNNFAVRGLDESGDVCTPTAEDHHRIVVIIRDENDAEISCSSLVLDENGEGIAEAFNVGFGAHCVIEVRPDG